MFRVTKQIDFCYGHRLLNYNGPCRHLHGHNASLEVDIESEELDDRGMVQDFSEIKSKIKAWIDENLDHRMLLNKEDPIIPKLQRMGELFYEMKDNPTVENIAKLIYNMLRTKGVPVVEVRLWENPTSFATYRV